MHFTHIPLLFSLTQLLTDHTEDVSLPTDALAPLKHYIAYGIACCLGDAYALVHRMVYRNGIISTPSGGMPNPGNRIHVSETEDVGKGGVRWHASAAALRCWYAATTTCGMRRPLML